jgi:prevent-host-death family protein
MQKQFSIAEAKNRLPTIVHSVENGPSVELTRRGKPVAVILSIQEYERLSRKYTGVLPVDINDCIAYNDCIVLSGRRYGKYGKLDCAKYRRVY